MVNSVCSEVLGIKYGVPQGSLLGPLLVPLLFLIYINDIKNYVSGVNVNLLADDTNLFVHARDINSVVLEANKCLADLSEWFSANKLCLSVDKTGYTVFGSNDTAQLKISICGNEIKQVSSCQLYV